MNTHNMGGGEVLDYISKSGNKVSSNLDDRLIQMFKMVPFVKITIYFLLMVIMIYIILKLFKIRSILIRRAIRDELKHVDAVRKRDASILRANKFMRKSRNFIEKTPLALSKKYIEYWQYNITRAGIKIPGGSRYMTAVEFNALIRIFELFSISVALLIMLFLNSILGWVLVIFTIVIANYCPMAVVRQKVKAKDNEIVDNFTNFYLMIHYVLIANSTTPLSGVIKSYDTTTTSKEMHRFVDSCIHYIDTYGEYEAAAYIAKDYREIPQVGKLMRLIKQANEGGNVEEELLGFRAELIRDNQYAIKKRMQKIVNKAKRSFNILMIILFQAVLSAMSIYFSDLGLIKGIIGY